MAEASTGKSSAPSMVNSALLSGLSSASLSCRPVRSFFDAAARPSSHERCEKVWGKGRIGPTMICAGFDDGISKRPKMWMVLRQLDSTYNKYYATLEYLEKSFLTGDLSSPQIFGKPSSRPLEHTQPLPLLITRMRAQVEQRAHANAAPWLECSM